MAEESTKPTDFEAKVSGRCPCGGTFHAGYATHPETKLRAPMVMHTMPHCDSFAALAPVEYLAYTRGLKPTSN